MLTRTVHFVFRTVLCLGLTAPVSGWAEPVTTIRSNGDSANRVDMAVLGDGYTETELGKFALDTETAVAGFFAQQPFKEYEKYFNVHRIDVISTESGADHPELGTYKATALDATYNCAGIQRLICVNASKVMTVVNNSVAPNQMDIILVIVNDPTYGGSGGSITVASTHSSVVELVLHETGHTFGLLADEYNSGSCNNASEPAEVNVTKEISRDRIKWNVGGGPPTGWIELSTPLPTTSTTTGIPGLYEGAKYCVTGLYRPTYRSKMEILGFPFEQINEEQLIKRTYNWVSPIDASSPAESIMVMTGSSSQVFQITVPTPSTHSLTAIWTLNGATVGTGLTYTLNGGTVGPGTHALEVTVTDPTEKVRNDPAKVLVETRSWTVSVTTAADTDGDGIPDFSDNCTHVKNPDQRDTNSEGYGNICDPDLNNDGIVNFADLAIMKLGFFGNNPDADLNGDGVVNFGDLAILKTFFFKAPGPSGLVP
ncbi:MAG: M64 family metallopeptidase [Sulfuricaulis sp.]|nr:M64 family metallopeptidase [Sulfuricaulis sp.]